MFVLSHSAVGGLRELWNDLAEGLRARGHDARVVAFYPDGEPGTAAARDPLPWRHLVPHRPRSPIAAFRLMRALRAFIRREKPDVIITAMPAANVVVPLAVRSAATPTRVIISHHSPTDTHNPLLDRVDGLTGSLNCVQSVVSVSDTVSASLARKPGRYQAKRRTIYNALPPRVERTIADLVTPGARVARSRTVVATGRLSPQKNYPLLIRAAARMPDVTVEIIGSGAEADALAALARSLGVGDRVHFLGQLPREETLARVARADVFVQVSRYEGHSLALIEAAKLGLPLIVSDVPVQIESITASDGTRCGVIVGLEDDERLARELLTLLDDGNAYQQWADLSRSLGEEASHDAMLLAYEALASGS